MAKRSPKVYRIYRHPASAPSNVNFVKIGGKAWMVFSTHTTRPQARRKLDHLKWSVGDPGFYARVVKLSTGRWGVVTLTKKKQYQTSTRNLVAI